MKRMRTAIVFIALASMLCAFSIPAFAIGFDAEEVYESVFVIYADNSVGSGFALGKNCVVTNAHVVENARSIILSSYDGTNYLAAVYLLDEETDIALLVSPNADFTALPIADLDKAKIGDDIYTIGAPNSMAYTLTKGVISAKERIVRQKAYIQIDAAINAGNSGGPLLNDSGEVLGINTLKISDSEGIGLSIPITTVCSVVSMSGVSLDGSYHVIGELPVPAPTEDTNGDNGEAADSGRKNKGNNSVLIVLLCISVILNICLATALLNKKRTHTVVPDPSERTDFEIEIEEEMHG